MRFRLFGYNFAFHNEGRSYILVSSALSLLFLLKFGVSSSFLCLLFITFCLAGFFRDPERVSSSETGVVVSPADGIVVGIDEVPPIEDLAIEDKKMLRVSIFLSVFDVHVNRIPVAGKIARVKYHEGKFFNAASDKASDENERNSITIESEFGSRIGCVQIAGLVARRIVCKAEVGGFFGTGERYGIIKFGSRVDLYLPLSCKPKVLVGQRMVGGETVISLLK